VAHHGHKVNKPTYFLNPDVTPTVSVRTVLHTLHLADHFFVTVFSLKSVYAKVTIKGTFLEAIITTKQQLPEYSIAGMIHERGMTM